MKHHDNSGLMEGTESDSVNITESELDDSPPFTSDPPPKQDVRNEETPTALKPPF
jgi:hypothetical protein